MERLGGSNGMMFLKAAVASELRPCSSFSFESNCALICFQGRDICHHIWMGSLGEDSELVFWPYWVAWESLHYLCILWPDLREMGFDQMFIYVSSWSVIWGFTFSFSIPLHELSGTVTRQKPTFSALADEPSLVGSDLSVFLSCSCCDHI